MVFQLFCFCNEAGYEWGSLELCYCHSNDMSSPSQFWLNEEGFYASNNALRKYTYTHIYVHTHTHTHTHIYMYIYDNSKKENHISKN